MHNRKAFLDAVPRQFLSRILRIIFEGCASAYDKAKQYPKEFELDAIPPLRRLAVEPMLQDIQLPPGFRSSLIETPSTHYTKIESDVVVLTALTRNVRRNWVRREPYRESLANDGQTDMWALLGYDTQEEDTKRLYGLLIYGGPHNKRLPTVADLVFPLPDSGYFADDKIDLMKEFPEIAASYEQQDPQAEPRLRVVAKPKPVGE